MKTASHSRSRNDGEIGEMDGNFGDRPDRARRQSRERSGVSYSFREPEWPAVCECKYDEIRDEMDREDCSFHCDVTDDSAEEEALFATRKRASCISDVKKSAA